VQVVVAVLVTEEPLVLVVLEAVVTELLQTFKLVETELQTPGRAVVVEQEQVTAALADQVVQEFVFFHILHLEDLQAGQ